MTDDEKLKYALEELNKWMRHMENFLWGVSSILLTATIGSFFVAIKYLNSELLYVIGLGIIICIIWSWYKNFLTDITNKIENIYKRINNYEKDFNIDILPDIKEEEMNNLFPKMMIKTTYLIWLSWGSFIIIKCIIKCIKVLIRGALC